MSFQDYLLSIGYTPFRVLSKDGKKGYVPAMNNHFSTYEHGFLDIRYIRLGKEICFGLHENGKPPTLIYPRPKGIESDDEMNIILMNLPPEIIMKLIC